MKINEKISNNPLFTHIWHIKRYMGPWLNSTLTHTQTNVYTHNGKTNVKIITKLKSLYILVHKVLHYTYPLYPFVILF